jgi:hypothetical protein
MAVGTICHVSPYLSFSQPHRVKQRTLRSRKHSASAYFSLAICRRIRSMRSRRFVRSFAFGSEVCSFGRRARCCSRSYFGRCPFCRPVGCTGSSAVVSANRGSVLPLVLADMNRFLCAAKWLRCTTCNERHGRKHDCNQYADHHASPFSPAGLVLSRRVLRTHLGTLPLALAMPKAAEELASWRRRPSIVIKTCTSPWRSLF